MSTINLQGGNTLLSTGSFPPVRAASTGSPLTPAAGGLLTVDGVSLAVGDRVLCKDETSAVDNGLYSAATGPWTRTSDAAGNSQFYQGMTVTCGPQGTVNAGQTFVCTCTDDPVVVGTSQITWASQATVQTQQQSATSTTSLTIGTGSKSLTVQSGKAFAVNQWVLIQEASNSANQMLGQITSYSGSSLVVSVTATGGSGTHSDWTIVLTNSAAAAGYQPPVGTGNVTGPGSSTAGHLATFADGTGKVLQDGGAPIGAANTITPSMFALAAVGFALGMLNGYLSPTIASNALTIAVKTLAGNDPSSSDPVFFLIRNGTTGAWSVIEQTSALSITVPAGATLGTVNGQANRIWVSVFNNSGAPVLGVYNSLNSSGPSIIGWDETRVANSTGITSGSTSPQLWYTGSTLSSINFRILGYVESTQTTAGQWAATVAGKVFSPGVKKPGDTVQEPFVSLGSGTSTSSSYVVLVTGSVNLVSAANLVRVEASGTYSNSFSGNAANTIRLSRGSTNNTNLIGNQSTTNTATLNGNATFDVLAYDLPNVAGTQNYSVQGLNSNGTTTLTGGTSMAFREIQI